MTTVENPLCSALLDRARGEFFASGDAAGLLANRTHAVDTAVRQTFEETFRQDLPRRLALLAVGGYGRGELFPHSDVDLLLLVDRAPDIPDGRTALSAFLQRLWDLGLRPSHSVRTAAECCEFSERNIELSISLLDQRFLAGDLGLYQSFAPLWSRFRRSRREVLVQHLCRLGRNRHARYDRTIHHLEPNVKEAPGGLRDLQLVRWLAKLDERIPDLEVEAGVEPDWRFLSTLRCCLHLEAGRDQNLLRFDLQDEFARLSFFGAKDVSAWMRDYFHHAKSVHFAATRRMETSERVRSSLLTQFRGWRSRLSNTDFTVSGERLYLREPHQLEHDPELLLRLFLFVARHGVRLAFDTEMRIAELEAAFAAWFSVSRPVWPQLRELLALPSAALALRSMQETGVLRAMFPEWGAIECLVVRDFHHRYTVDEHTLVCLETLERLRQSGASPPGRFAELLVEVDRLDALLFALLFHDTGKAHAGLAHAAASVRLAGSALERIQAPEAVGRNVRFLIQRHLDLSAVMNSRDLDEPATAEFLAHRVGTLEDLKQLVLLTYADISAVNPSAMTPWRLEQLWRVYLVASHELTRELEAERIEAAPPQSAGRAAFLEGFPTRYLRTQTDGEIEKHSRLYDQALARGAAADVAREYGVWRLTLATPDRPALLASIAGALAGSGMNIRKAEAFANRRGMVLDTFVFEDPHRTLELNPGEAERLRLTVERVALGKVDTRRLLENRPAPVRPSRRARIKPVVSFDSEASASATLIEIVGEDRPGLLHDLASAISSAGCNIEVVLIDTEAHKALDVFYVSIGGHKLWPEHMPPLRESLMRVLKS